MMGIIAASRLGDGAHEVSILMSAVCAAVRSCGALQRSKVSMMIMRPPQHGQRYGSVRDSSIVSASVGLP
jgi:hypothetical protein